ncbi:MAG: VOC family protein [Coriobacteriia bacterium]|nr:VOC family protein [Coriobacteriia bacterium]
MGAAMKTILFPTSDIDATKRLFTQLLGMEPFVDEPYYVGFQIGDIQVGIDPTGGDRGMTGATPFFEVDDVRAAVDELTGLGADLVEDVRSVGGGKQIAMLSDPEGSMIGLAQTP